MYLGRPRRMGNGYGATGDIVLTPDTESKSKKLIIFAIVFVALILVGVVVWFVISNTLLKPTPESTRERFNKFANYVISGEELTTEINPELDLSYDYYFSDDTLTTDQKKTIYNKTKNLLNQFLNSYNRLDEAAKESVTPDTERFALWSDSTKQLLDFITVAYTKDSPTKSQLREIYANEGRQAAEEYLANYYDFSNIKDNPYQEQFLAYLEDWGNEVIDIRNTAEISQEAQAIYSRLQYYYSLSDDLVFATFVLNALVNNGNVEAYV